MADIIDRLITRVQFVGVSDAISNFTRIAKSQESIAEAEYVASRATALYESSQAKLAAATLAVSQAQARQIATQNELNRAMKIGSHPSFLAPYQTSVANATEEVAQAEKNVANAAKEAATAQRLANKEALVANNLIMKQNQTRTGLGLAGGTLVAFGLLQIAGAAAETSIKFENMRTSLTTLYRDAAKGQQAFNWVLKFAKETPFSIESATQAFIRLTSLGIQPTRRNLMILGGLGQMFHRDFEDVAMAAGIGASGNFSRLIRGFGIRREDVARNAPPGTIPLTGAISAQNRPIVFEAILRTIEQKFPQAFEKFANTTETARSNFYDSIQQILASFANLIAGSDNLKQTFDTLTTIAGFVNNFIKVLDILKNAILFTVMQIASLGLELVNKLTFGLADRISGGRLKGAEAYLDAASREASRQIIETVKGMSKYANAGEPPKVPGLGMNGGTGENPAFAAIRQIVGQSGIARIGVNASELPGIGNNMLRKQPLLVKIEGSEGSDFMKLMEDAFNKLLYDANRHGVSLQPNRG